jgi:antitoxin component of MazEF toxin-antitoxin module
MMSEKEVDADLDKTLAELAAEITPENRHPETQSGQPLGKEFW